ncbi:protein YciZ/DeoL [Leclercia sp.]|uniref:protein YciZ/DeoL n=1 Tax=Leclercia sp. TaxID=1898428 RepID=UPI002FDEEDB5
MSDIDALKVAQRIDTVLDILVAGDVNSALRNLEILKSELLAQAGAQKNADTAQPKSPWEV